jgi:hypothetical protein
MRGLYAFKYQPYDQLQPWRSFPGTLELMILESLRRQPAYGYALVQHIEQRSNNLLQVEEGSLYPALQRLLKARLVMAEWRISFTNRRIRIYRISSKSPVLQGEIQRADALFYTVFAGTIAKFLHWNTKSVQYPRAGEALITCEVSPAGMGLAAGTHRGTL